MFKKLDLLFFKP